MFCMGCGAELRPAMDRCAVCGRPLDGAAQALRQGRTPSASSSASLVAPMTGTAPMSPSIARGDIATVGLPRDATGRALLGVVLVMVADLLVPWLEKFGVRWTPAQVGVPVLIVVALLAVALVPLANPALRSDPLVAAAPLAVGAATFGAVALLWVLVHTGAVYGSIANTPQTSGLLDVFSEQVASVDLGLYIFLLGSGVLTYLGYRVFLAAAQANVVPARPVEVATVAKVAAESSALVTSAAGAASGALAMGQAAEATRPLFAATTPPSGANASADGIGTPAKATTPRVALPGTAEWNTAPTPPEHMRPSPTSGWRQPGARR